MAILILTTYGAGLFSRNGFKEVKTISSWNSYESLVRKEIQRDGYMREIGRCVLSFDRRSEHPSIDEGHPTFEDICKFFNVPSDRKEDQVINIGDPWMCFAENYCLVIYFGKDKPVLQTKTTKSHTKHKKFWANNNKWWSGNEKDHKYYYWHVKEKDKLVLCRFGHDLYHTFPEFLNKRTIPPYGQLDVLSIEPFKPSYPYDYSDEEKSEIIRKREEEERRRKEYEVELDRLKHTPGHCECCGSANADWVHDPYEYDMNNRTIMRWSRMLFRYRRRYLISFQTIIKKYLND